MMLMTKAIEKAARQQYPQGANMDQKVVAKFFNPLNDWKWYLMNQDPENPDYLWGIVKGHEIETGSFSLAELETIKLQFGLGIERDKYFKARPAQEVLESLNNGEFV